MFFSFFFILLTITTSAFAEIGGTCRAEGVKGTCQKIASCGSGITVKGACPNDPDGVRCCIKKPCEDGNKQGSCFDKRNNNCSGGKFITGKCPGDDNMLCCIKSSNPSPPSPPPSPPKCPGARSINIPLFPDDIIFNRAATKTVGKVYQGASKLLDVCELVAGALPGPGQAVGIGCGVAKLGSGFIGEHAEQCAKKNMCLKLRAYTAPFCIGNDDGCCG